MTACTNPEGTTTKEDLALAVNPVHHVTAGGMHHLSAQEDIIFNHLMKSEGLPRRLEMLHRSVEMVATVHQLR